MSLCKSLEILSRRQGGLTSKYELLRLDDLLTNHSISIKANGYLLPSEISLFSEIKVGNIVVFNRDDLNIVEIEIKERRIRVENVKY